MPAYLSRKLIPHETKYQQWKKSVWQSNGLWSPWNIMFWAASLYWRQITLPLPGWSRIRTLTPESPGGSSASSLATIGSSTVHVLNMVMLIPCLVYMPCFLRPGGKLCSGFRGCVVDECYVPARFLRFLAARNTDINVKYSPEAGPWTAQGKTSRLQQNSDTCLQL